MTARVKETMDGFNTTKEEGRKANDRFNKIRKARAHKFNTAFKQIDEALKIIYTDMTKSSEYQFALKAFHLVQYQLFICSVKTQASILWEVMPISVLTIRMNLTVEE